MSVEIRLVRTKKEMKTFVQFANKMYKGNPYYCPTMDSDEYATFDKKNNPTLEFCTYELFLAYKGDECVGRIAAFINPIANEKWGCKRCRFGWMDFVDDKEVSKALLDAAAAWGKAQGMNEFNGPVGFTDLDRQGLLVEGFEEPSLSIENYSYPYYVEHLEAYGLKKDADWIEFDMKVPEDLDPKWYRVADIVMKRSDVHVVKMKNFFEIRRRYPNQEYFQLLSDCYSKLYNYQPLTQKQMAYYADHFVPFLNFDLVTILENSKNEIVGIAIGMPDIAPALRKCDGKLFPFGWYYLLKALKSKKIDHWSFLLFAVREDYQDKGINALFFTDQMPYFRKYHIKTADTGDILEDNHKSWSNFVYFEHEIKKRRRAYLMNI